MPILPRAAYDDRVFIGAIAAAVAIKLVLALLLPVTGDEAYFIQYGRAVDWGGFYDHPPMIGWILWLIERISSHPLVLRLPAIAAALIVALGLYQLLRPVDQGRARLLALILLFSPVYLVNVLVTTDTPLIAFGLLSAVALQLALRHGRLPLFAVAGVLLGLAFLSKYFAVLLGVAYLVLIPLAGREHWRGFLLLFASALPFGLFNLAWNYCHCWNHILFNVFNRAGGSGPSPEGLALYGLMLAYLFALPGWYLLRERRRLRHELDLTGGGALVLCGGVPLLLFALVALFFPGGDIGLHWPLLFVPLVMAAGIGLSQEDLARGVRFMAWFGGGHALILGGVLAMPVQVFDGRTIARDAVFYLEPTAYTAAIAEFEGDFHATDSYARAAVSSYYSRHHWRVFGTGSRHGRLDDTLTDWREHDGDTMVFLSRDHDIDRDALTPHFTAVEIETFRAAGQAFEVARAEDFDYTAYRDSVLREIRDRYYALPHWLPMGGCPFLERYFPEAVD